MSNLVFLGCDLWQVRQVLQALVVEGSPQDQHSLPTALLVLLFSFSLLEILLLACLGFGLEVVAICMFMISWPRLSDNCNSWWTSMSLWFVAFTMPRYLKECAVIATVSCPIIRCRLLVDSASSQGWYSFCFLLGCITEQEHQSL